MSAPVADDQEWQRERFAEVRGEHGWARYVDDETLAAWLWPTRAPDEPDRPATR